jgi:hypothetical protein
MSACLQFRVHASGIEYAGRVEGVFKTLLQCQHGRLQRLENCTVSIAAAE